LLVAAVELRLQVSHKVVRALVVLVAIELRQVFQSAVALLIQ
jgi:hypothetical protein